MNQNNTVPLEEILPFSSTVPRSILICDSIETDASFLLHCFTAQAIKKNKEGQSSSSSSSSKIWWFTAKPITEKQLTNGLKKMGSSEVIPAITTFLKQQQAIGNNDSDNDDHENLPLKITSLISEITEQVLLEEKDEYDGGEAYLKDLYRQIKKWTVEDNDDIESCRRWILLDDISLLSTVIGNEILVYQFVHSIQALVTNQRQNVGLIIRCTMEFDQTIIKASNMEDGESHDSRIGWLGAGGSSHRDQMKRIQQEWIPWERQIVECMDIIVDVVPLSSGYSREAHGRLIFTECPGGRGWSRGSIPTTTTTTTTSTSSIAGATSVRSASSTWDKFVINYCLQESGVRAIRLRESSMAS